MRVLVSYFKFACMKGMARYIYLSGIALLLASCVDTPVPEEYKPTGEAHYLEVSQTELSFGSDAESKKVNINSSQSWMFSDYASWLSLSSDSGERNSEISINPCISPNSPFCNSLSLIK